MSLVDRTNETIPLSLHIDSDELEGELYVDADSDSSFIPSSWVAIHFTDDEHDSDRIKLTYEEAGLLHDRLGLILSRPTSRMHRGIDISGGRFAAGPYGPPGGGSGVVVNVSPVADIAYHSIANTRRGMTA